MQVRSSRSSPEATTSEGRAAWRKPGGVLVLLGVLLVGAGQVYVIQFYLGLAALLPAFPPESIPGVRLLLSLLLLNVGVAFACAVALVVGAVLILKGRPAAGGLVALVFEAPVFIVSGAIGMIGAILAIAGGVLSMLSAIRAPRRRRTGKSKPA